MLHQVKEALRVKMANNEYITLVHEATNEDPWGPTGPQMDDIAKVFHNGHSEIMDELILRLKHRKESWRMCYKSMLVIDHLARNVHESSLPIIMPVAPLLRQISMNYTCNEKGVDRGLSVRERARKLADLLTDGELLRDERQKAEQTRRKVAGEPISMGTASPSQRAPSHSSSAGPPSAQSASARGNPAGGALRTNLRAEQEQQDMILAMRLQTEEDRRAQAAGQTIDHGGPILVGRTVKPAAKKASMPSYPKPTSQEEADHYLALEMQRRLDNGEPITPTVFEQLTFRPPTTTTTAGSTTAPVASSSGAAPPKAQASTLDDLFAFGNNTSAPPPPPPPSAPSTTLEGTSSSPPASAASKNRHNGPQQPAELTATSLFADTTSTYNRNTSTTSSSSQQQQQQGAAFDPFSTAPPPPPPPQGETDFFDNFLAQRKDLHKSASQQQQATTTSSSSATAATNAGSLEFFQTSSSSSSLPSHKNNNNNTDAAVAAPNGTDLFELQMQRLSVSAQPSSQQQQTAARGMTLDDMLRDGKSF